jgi:signal peptidase I
MEEQMKKLKVKKYIYRFWKEWRLLIFIIIFIVIPVKSSLADWNWVPSGSMNPTILEGDLIYVNKLAYDLRFPLTMHRLARWSNPERGDIVICFSPDDGTRLVKRIIAQPGDEVEMRNNIIYLNGEKLDYKSIDLSYKKSLPHELGDKSVFAMEDLDGNVHVIMSVPSIRAKRNFGPIVVPDGKYFVLGDNRDCSKDSRFFGFVERDSIVGKAKGIIGSFDITDKCQPRFGRFFESLQ